VIRHKLFKFLRDPLFHFLVLDARVFLAYSVVKESAGVAPDRSVVEETQALRLAGQFQRTWMRPPSQQELQGLADDFVR
jgi:hypothetical protein